MAFPALVSSTPQQMAAYVCSDQGAEVARDVVRRTGGVDSAVRGGGLSGAARLSTGKPIARTLITEIGNIPVPVACESVTEIRKTGADVIVLGHQSDIATYRALRGAGALDYFAFPVTAEEILAIEARAPANSPAPVPALAPCVGVTGANGGVGASLLAQNLAIHAAAARGLALRTALIDADLRFGTQAIDLDLDDTPGLQEALSAPDRIDPTFIGATMQKVGENLSLYSHQIRGGQPVDGLERAMPRLARALRPEFDALVLDLPRAALIAEPDLAAELSALVLVLPSGYAGVNAASRLIARLREAAPGLVILPVLSEVRRDAGLSVKDIAKAIGHEIRATLPRADKDMARAQRAARALVELQPRGAYAKAVGQVWIAAAEAAPRPVAPKSKRGGFRTLFG